MATKTKIIDNKHLGQLLYNRMLEKGMTYYQLSQKVGITQGYVKKIMDGEQDTGINKYIIIAEALDLKLFI